MTKLSKDLNRKGISEILSKDGEQNTYKRRIKMTEEKLPEYKIEPASAWPPRYDPQTHFRTSPDIKKFRGADGVWYHATGIRDQIRSPIQRLSYFLSY